MWLFLGLAGVVKLAALLVFRVNMSSWSKVTFRDVAVLGVAVASVTGVEIAIVFALRPEPVVPASIPLLEAGVAMLSLSALRAARRAWNEQARRRQAGTPEPVLVIGAGEAGTLLVREMLRHPEVGLKPVGFVDDDPDKLGLRVGGVPVLGTRDDLPDLLEELPVDEVLIAIPSAEAASSATRSPASTRRGRRSDGPSGRASCRACTS